MTTLTVHTIDRTKTSMNRTLPDTLDIFEMQKRRHDLAFCQYKVYRKASILSGSGFNKFLASQNFFCENATD